MMEDMSYKYILQKPSERERQEGECSPVIEILLNIFSCFSKFILYYRCGKGSHVKF